MPFLEAVEILQRNSTSAADSIKRVAPAWHTQLTAPETGEPAPSQERIRRELAALLRDVSRREPVVLFFDDPQWADVSTVDLLAFLGGRLDGLRLLIIVAYRSSDLLLARHPFLQLKRDLQARGAAHEMQLGFLSRGEIEEFLAIELPKHQLPPELPALIHAKTEGSPLFMADLVRYLRDRQVIAQQEGRWVLACPLPETERELPESVRAMIERKIAQLGDQDRRVLAAASVQGYQFDSTVINLFWETLCWQFGVTTQPRSRKCMRKPRTFVAKLAAQRNYCPRSMGCGYII